MPTLELIAERTNKPLAYFLERQEPAGLPAELLHRVAWQTPAELLDWLEKGLSDISDPWMHAIGIYQRALSLQALGHHEEAIESFRQASEGFAQAADPWSQVEALDYLAHLLAARDPEQALALAREASLVGRDLDPVPVLQLARVHALECEVLARQGRIEEALEAQGEARGYAERADPEALATYYERLAQILHAQGRDLLAIAYAQRATAFRHRSREEMALSASEQALGQALAQAGRPEDAAAILESAAKRLERAPVRPRVRALIGLAEFHFERGELETATAQVRSVLEQAGHLELEETGRAHELAGRIAAGAQNQQRAEAEFEQALALYRKLGLQQRTVDCYMRYAEMLEQTGDSQRAVRQLQEALGMFTNGSSKRPRLPTS